MPKLHYATNCVVSRRVLDAIRSRHPLKLEAELYRPGFYEIGHGNRSDVPPYLRISPCIAEDLLRNDVMYVEAFIRMAVARPISDACYDALVSYLYDASPKSEAARLRLAALHDHGEEGFLRGLASAAAESRFGSLIGASARLFEVTILQA